MWKRGTRRSGGLHAAAEMSESGQRSVEMHGSYNVVTSTNLTDEKLEEQQDGDEGH